MDKENTQNSKEEFTLSGDQIVAKVKELVKQGNARKIVIKNEIGETILEFPVTVGAIGVIAAPIVAAVGAAAALLTKCTIVVEKKKN